VKPAILIVDDEPLFRDYLRSLLEPEGYTVDEAENGKEAIEALARPNPPNLVLLDLNMPVMSGTEFLKIRQEQDHLRRIPVVVISGRGHTAGQPKGVQLLHKLISVPVLLEAVKLNCAIPA
jgi:CheY-like chemotaxis protein